MPRPAAARRPPPPRASARRDEVLAAAARAFEWHGYAGTSMRRIADEAGILPGSVYHHFDAKESIAGELVERLQRDLTAVVARFSAERGDLGTLRALARETATLSERHRAAVELCLYEAPTSASPRLADLLRARPLGDEATWRRLVRDAVESGALRLPEGDADLLALALLESSWTIGLVVRDVPAPALADVCTDVLLRGLLAERDRPFLPQRRLEALLAEMAERWRPGPDGDDSRRRQLLDTARDEFARRGFDATTMRDLAVATGTPMATLYRRFRSKEELLGEIVHRFSGPLLAGFRDVVAAADGPVGALDGLIGLMALAGSVYGREYDAVRTWWRVVVPEHPDASAAEQGERLAILRGVLAAGVAEGHLRALGEVDVLAVCVRELLWLPYRQLREDPGQVQEFLRRTVLSGAAA